MVILHIAGKSNDPGMVVAEHLADFAALNLARVHVQKHLLPESEWDEFVEGVCSEYRFAWKSRESPFVWTDAGVLIGGKDAFIADVEKRFGLRLIDSNVPSDIGSLVRENIAVAEVLHQKKLASNREEKVVRYMKERSVRLDVMERTLKLVADFRHYLRVSIGCESNLMASIATLNSAKTMFGRWKALKEKLESHDAATSIGGRSSSEARRGQDAGNRDERADGDLDLGLDDNWPSDDDSVTPSPRSRSPRSPGGVRHTYVSRGEKIRRIKRHKKALFVTLRKIHLDDSLGINRIVEKLGEFMRMFEQLEKEAQEKLYLVDIHELIGGELAVISEYGPCLEEYETACRTASDLLGKLAEVEKSVLKPKLRLSLGALNVSGNGNGDKAPSHPRGGHDETDVGAGASAVGQVNSPAPAEAKKQKEKEKEKEKKAKPAAVEWDPVEVMATAETLHAALAESYASFNGLAARVVELKEALRGKKKLADSFQEAGIEHWVSEEVRSRVLMPMECE